MPAIVNPMDALLSFEPALRRGEIDLQSGDVDPNVYVHLDHPNGEPRFTYVRLAGAKVTAIAIVTMVQPYQGRPCFQIGYAVPKRLRQQGRAKDIALAALAELQAGLGRSGLKDFYVEAIVAAKNRPSQIVAENVLGGPPRETIDEHSGEAALQYIRKFGSD